MTAVQQPLTGDSGLHWDVNNMADSDLEELEDDESNSAKLFERSRIRALAGMFECRLRLYSICGEPGTCYRPSFCPSVTRVDQS